MVGKVDLLFEEYKSAVKSSDSMQDSLDKAYLAIAFGEIAFFALHIKSQLDIFWFNCVALLYMAIVLILILTSFALSKVAMERLKWSKFFQMRLLTDTECIDSAIAQNMREEILQLNKDIDRRAKGIRQLNWHIPIMIVFSSLFCFIKVSFIQTTKTDIIWLLGMLFLYICMSIVSYVLVRRI